MYAHGSSAWNFSIGKQTSVSEVKPKIFTDEKCKTIESQDFIFEIDLR